MLHATPMPSSFPGVPPLPRDIRTLLLDDSNFDRARIRRLSHKTDLCIHMDEVESIAAMDDAVSRENYDLILIDYRLPIGDGMEALDHLFKSDLNKGAGKIMITGEGARQTAMQAIRNGYHGFLTKAEMDAEGLRDAIINAVTLARQQQQLILQASQQREFIREGLVAALQDSEVQSNVVSLVRENRTEHRSDQIRSRFEAAEIDQLLAGLDDEDEFVFH